MGEKGWAKLKERRGCRVTACLHLSSLWDPKGAGDLCVAGDGFDLMAGICHMFTGHRPRNPDWDAPLGADTNVGYNLKGFVQTSGFDTRSVYRPRRAIVFHSLD